MTPAPRDHDMPGGHQPVMLREVLAVLNPRGGGIYVDGTFGAGGYARALLEAADCTVWGIDRDPDAIAAGKTLAERHAGRLHLVAGRFGEMAALANLPRSATAVAQTPCRVIALDQQQFRKALARKPAFALMLMKVMVARLRDAVARLKRADPPPGDEPPPQEPPVFNPQLLAGMVRGLCDDAPVTFLRNQVILEEGQVGTRMYAVLEGHVAVTINGAIVDRIGPGGMLGELALLDQSPRLATATAEDNVVLQPINRNAFIALVKLDAELGALFDDPLQVVKLEESDVERNGRGCRLGSDGIFQLKHDAGLVGLDNGGQPSRTVVADLIVLAAFDAQDACEVMRVVTRDLSPVVMELVDEEAPACHVQSSVS